MSEEATTQRKNRLREATSYWHCALHYSVTVKSLTLVAVPAGVLTLILPVTAPNGTVAVT